MNKLLLISHIVPSYINTDEKLMIGDAIRLLLAAKVLLKNNIETDLCFSKDIYNIIQLSDIQYFLPPSTKIYNESIFTSLDFFPQYDNVIYADNPCFWPIIKKKYSLPEIDLLWSCEEPIQMKTIAKNLVSNLLIQIGITHSLEYDCTNNFKEKRVGLNYIVPFQWKTKSPPKDLWNLLFETLLEKDYQPSWQEGENNIKQYLKWLKNQNVIITANTLGFHLAMLFEKGIILLSGSTWCEESSWLSKEYVFEPKHCELYPCYQKECPVQNSCFKTLSINDILERVNLCFQ